MASIDRPDNGILGAEIIDGLRAQFESDKSAGLMQNAVAKHDVHEIALNKAAADSATHSYSNVLDDWSPTHQGQTGRCWLFAGLNLFRVDTMKALNVKQFEFSQNYLMFWDKIERANFVLESVISTADRPVDDRTVAWILDTPVPDAGQWDMFINLVKKYGVVPKSVMPETQSSGATMRMNSILYYQIRQGALKIRGLYAQEAGLDAMRDAKSATLGVIYPGAVHPPGHASGELRLAVDRQGRRLPPRRRGHAAGVRG